MLSLQGTPIITRKLLKRVNRLYFRLLYAYKIYIYYSMLKMPPKRASKFKTTRKTTSEINRSTRHTQRISSSTSFTSPPAARKSFYKSKFTKRAIEIILYTRKSSRKLSLSNARI